ncbi:MAG: hypothetical protein WDO19_19750 [Bacteroidota bacterium]
MYDKIGKPRHFKPVNEIADDEIGNAWAELKDHLNKFSINLGVCSPNISVRELYRFTTEELFEHEMDDMDLPGWTTNFTYDEFHPDLVYDNSRMVEADLLVISSVKKICFMKSIMIRKRLFLIASCMKTGNHLLK